MPKNVRFNWVEEINRFSTHRLRTTIIDGDDLTRVRQFFDALRIGDEVGTVLIMSYGTMVAIQGMLTQVEWDFVGLDEIHYIKSTRTRRYKAAIALRDKARKRAGATGTAVANTPLDLYAIWEFLGEGYSGFHTQKGFNKYYGKYRVDPVNGNLLVGVQENKLPLLQERLARMSFSITLKEALPELPDKVYDVIECVMTAEQKELYRKVQDDIAIQINNELNSDRVDASLKVNNILTMLLKLSQVTSGFLNFPEIYSEDGSGTCIQEAHTLVLKENPKVDELVNLFAEKEKHEKTLIWACYKQDIITINNRLKAIGLDGVTFTGDTSDADRKIAEERFNNDPDCRWFLGNPSAGGTGLNLLGYKPHSKDPTTFTNHEIYFSQGWSYIHRDQSEARAHRRGTITNVRITDLIFPGTIDEDIRLAVMDKKKMSISLGDLHVILSRVLEHTLGV
jgi:SNF2 family DNA or RNA helicase